MHYQPKVDLYSGELAGAEALVRWQHPVRGRISPADFIPVAEESELIVAIGDWVVPSDDAERVEAQLTVDFADAISGLETTLYLTAETQCSTCHGSGAKPGTAPRVCSNCGGRGVVDDNQGLFSFSAPCHVCQGTGQTIDEPCPTCRGAGIEKRAREVKTRLPAGVKDGQTIRLKGRGGPGRNGGPNGDLLVQLTVRPHERFGRSGSNLTVTVPISFVDAALGADIDVPALDGTTVKLRIRPGTQSGSRHRVKGKGIHTAKATGDLIVTVTVMVPTHLSTEQRQAIEQLAAATTVTSKAPEG